MRISPLQEYEPTDWSGLTTVNHLGAIYGQKPQEASKLVSMIHQINFGMDLDTFLNRFPVLYLDTDDDFTWKLRGDSNKNVPLVSARIGGFSSTTTVSSSSHKAGLNHSKFILTFAEKFFSDVDVIVGERNEVYPIQITDIPRANGTNWDYECELLTADPTLYIPYTELLAGKRFSREWSLVEKTLSKKGGQVNYTSPFQMRNQFSMIRMQDTRAGNMINRPVAFSWKDPKTGKVMSTWTQYADWELEKQFQEQKNRLLMFATTNRGSDGKYVQKGKSGFELSQGAGIRQQMESSNSHFYNTFSIKWLTEVMLDMSINKLPGDKREFVLRTGEWGMYQFHVALEEYASLYTPLFDESRIKRVGKNGIQFNGQFLEYLGPQGIKVSLMHEPMYDDPARNKIRHQDGGLAESYRYDILDVGTSDGEANIRKVALKGQEDIMGYVPGLRHPYKLDGSRNIMADPTDGYTLHRAAVLGAMVKDPTRTAALIPSVLR